MTQTQDFTTTTPSKKRLGLLTAGGDCAGLNAAIRGVVLHATQTYGWEIVGIRYGQRGLLEDPPLITPLTAKDVDAPVLREASTLLGTTNTANPLNYLMPDGSRRDRSAEVVKALQDMKLDGLICIGGDGTIKSIEQIGRMGNIPLIGIPKTIDNDVTGTEMALGFHSAVSVASEALDRLYPTAKGHERIMILEVMGRDAGHLALATGLAGGADIILIPEIPWHLDSLVKKLHDLQRAGKNYATIVVSEAICTAEGEVIQKNTGSMKLRYGGVSDYLADKLSEATGFEVRTTVLGYTPRGCAPTWTDRLIGQALGVHAIDLAAQNKFGRLVVWNNDRASDMPIEDSTASYRNVDTASQLVHMARSLGICLGD